MRIISYDDDFLPRPSSSSEKMPSRSRGRGHRRVSSFCCGGVVSISPNSIMNGLSRSSFSYDVLPQIPLKLTVCKLDGSSFEVEVIKTATVGELKQAVQEVFTNRQKKGRCKISWVHVWDHFCLCYDGWKLISDSECIADYMINDGDQLYFVQHKSVSKSIFRKQSKDKLLTSEEPKMSSCKSDGHIKREKNVEKEEASSDHGCSPSQCGRNGSSDITTQYEYKFAQILGRWFSYQKLGSSKKRKKSRDFSSKVADGLSGSFRSILRFCSNNKVNSQRDST